MLCSRLPPHRQQVASKCAGEESVRPREGSGRHKPQHEPGVGHKGDGSAAQDQQGGKALGQRAEAIDQVAGQGRHGASQQHVSQASLHGAWQRRWVAAGALLKLAARGLGGRACEASLKQHRGLVPCAAAAAAARRSPVVKTRLICKRTAAPPHGSRAVLGSDRNALAVRRTTGAASGTSWGCCRSCANNNRWKNTALKRSHTARAAILSPAAHASAAAAAC